MTDDHGTIPLAFFSICGIIFPVHICVHLAADPLPLFYLSGPFPPNLAKSFEMNQLRNTVFCRVLPTFLAAQLLQNEHFQEIPVSTHFKQLTVSAKPFRIRVYKKRGGGAGGTDFRLCSCQPAHRYTLLSVQPQSPHALTS